METQNEMTAMKEAARKAGEIIRENYGKVDFERKKDHSFVSDVDRDAEKMIKDILRKAFPYYGFIGEEEGSENAEHEYVWIIDPLDGTTNYKVQNPFFNVSIALSRNKTPVKAVVYHPITDDMFTAEKGKGAYRNDEKLEIKYADIKGFHAFCFGKDEYARARIGAVYNVMVQEGYSLRRMGAAALELAYVGAERVQSFFMIGVNAWDVAAGQLIAAEAGAMVTDLDGNPFTIDSETILAASPLIHEQMRRRLADIAS